MTNICKVPGSRISVERARGPKVVISGSRCYPPTNLDPWCCDTFASDGLCQPQDFISEHSKSDNLAHGHGRHFATSGAVVRNYHSNNANITSTSRWCRTRRTAYDACKNSDLHGRRFTLQVIFQAHGAKLQLPKLPKLPKLPSPRLRAFRLTSLLPYCDCISFT